MNLINLLTRTWRKMARVIQLYREPNHKPRLTRNETKKKKMIRGQLNLFNQEMLVINLPFRYKTFDQALFLDEHNSPFAKDAYLKAIEAGDCVADSYCNLGILYSENDEWKEAFDCFSRALINDPRHVEAHFNLANLYFDKNDLQLAKLHFEMTNTIDPSFPNSYFNLGLLYMSSGERENARTYFNRYVSLVSPDDAMKAYELMETLNTGVISN